MPEDGIQVPGCYGSQACARGIEIRSGGGSSSGSPMRSFDCSKVPNSLPSCECKSRTRSRSDNKCGFHSGSPSVHCGHSPDCVRRERECLKPSRLNRGDAGTSYSMRDDPGPLGFGHRHLHSDKDREASPWTSYYQMEREIYLLRETLTHLKRELANVDRAVAHAQFEGIRDDFPRGTN
ncbi:hypothetical protein Pyn_38924 [Prunus yedoensis var. nudiflora]|uniref:Uncharacterized protein n=1 Tax=Prunus yedoensis var. nudiflora TaxID=2094558 RepID=A0A314UMM1_PRUYE|nr:hypothetical protein Pyn_38924 [Prunus yedoensis var. nudiflora]